MTQLYTYYSIFNILVHIGIFYHHGGQTKDPSSTNSELIEELSAFKKRIKELERSESDLRKAEDALRESEERYRRLVDNTDTGFVVINDKGIVTEANEPYMRLIGAEKMEEIIGRSVIEWTAPEAQYGNGTAVALCSRQGFIQDFETIYLHRNGTHVHIIINATMYETTGGKRLVSFCRNITERKRAEEALIQIRKAVESSSEAIGMSNPQGSHFYQNKAFTDLFEYSVEEFNKPLTPVIVYEDPEVGREVFETIMQGDSWTGEIVMVAKSGRRFPVYLRADAIKDDRGNIIGLMGIHTDITERKRVETELLDSEMRLRDIIFNIADWAWEVDENGVYTYSSQKGFDILGRSNEDIIGKTPFDFMPQDEAERVAAIFSEIAANKAPIKDLENWNIGKNGKKICLLTNGVPILDKEGNIKGYRGVDMDITDRKRLEKELHRLSIVDELTGLYNRRGFITLSEQQLKIAIRTKKDMLLLFADLDKMKQINDTLGHQEGDKALIEIATVLKEVFRESDIIGRMGGDEFAALAIDAADETKEVLIDRLQKTLDGHNGSEGRNYTLSLSIGIAHYNPEIPSSLDELISQADTLMYGEKNKKQY